jgi:hypothetical protein
MENFGIIYIRNYEMLIKDDHDFMDFEDSYYLINQYFFYF